MVLRARQAQAGDDGSSAHRAERTILVVADDPDACEVLVRLLVHAGFRADGALDVAEAMSVLTQADADAVVLHTTGAPAGGRLAPQQADEARPLSAHGGTAEPRPRSAPLALLRALREGSAPAASVPVVAVVADADQAEVAQEGGADRVLRQPVHVDDLAAELDAATRP